MMAEILGVAASAIAFLQAASAVAKGLDKVYAAKNAEHEVRSLRDEIDRVQQVVTIVHAQLSTPIILEVAARDHLESCLNRAIDSASNLRLSIDAGLLHSKSGKTSRLKFLWRDTTGDLQRFRAQLVAARGAIKEALIIALFSAHTMRSMYVGISIAGQQQMGIQNVASVATRPMAIMDATQNASSASPSHDKELVAYVPPNFTAGITLDKDGQPSARVHPLHRTPDWTSFNVSISMRSACKLHLCRCSCHKTRQIQWPSFLGQFVMSLNVQYRGMPWLSQACDEEDCARQSADLTLQASFPRKLWDRVVVLKMRSYMARSPELLLRLYIPISWNESSVLRMANRGDLKEIRDELTIRPQMILASESTLSYSVLRYAVMYGNNSGDWSIAKFALRQGCDPHYAESQRVSPYLRYWFLLLQGDISSDLHHTEPGMEYDEERLYQTPLHAAILGRGETDFETALLRTSRIDINVLDGLGATALAWASRFCSLEQVQLLLIKGADPNIAAGSSRLPLAMACGADRLDVFETLLLAGGAEVNWSDGQDSLLHELSDQRNAVPFLEMALSRGLDLEVVDIDGQTALLYCLDGNGDCPGENSLIIFRWLVQHGADVDTPDHDGLTPLSRSIFYILHRELRMILDISTKSSGIVACSGDTVLMAAAIHGDILTLEILSDYELDVDCDTFDSQGMTAMDWAEARWKNTEWWSNLKWEGITPEPVDDAWYYAFCDLYNEIKLSQGLRACQNLFGGVQGAEFTQSLKIPGSFPDD